MPTTEGSGAGDRQRAAYLRMYPHWEEIELRLRYRHSPYEVVAWHRRRWPGEPVPSVRTLYRYLKTRPPGWFIDPLTMQELVTPHVPRLHVLAEQAAVIETLKLRLRQMLQLEQGLGLPLPEVRANLALLLDALDRHLRSQQEVGIEPKVVGPGRGEGDGGDRGATDELRQLLSRVLELPAEQFGPTLVALLGPPPVRQPLVLEGQVVPEVRDEDAQGDGGGAAAAAPP